jgi:hypothetical protein
MVQLEAVVGYIGPAIKAAACLFMAHADIALALRDVCSWN